MKKIIVSLLILIPLYSLSQKDVLAISNNLQPIAEDNIFKSEGYYNWCSSIIKGDDGQYHLFYSRWKKDYTFTGWLTHSEAAHAVSDSPAGPWEYKETVLRSGGKDQWDAITVHNPKIKRFNGKYYLYYITTNLGNMDYTEEDLVEIAQMGYSHPFWSVLRPNQRVGVAVSSSLDGPWKRLEQPLIEPSGPIATLTVNPAIAEGKDGKFYLIVKGDKPNDTNFVRNQAIAISESPIGPFVMQSKPVIDYMDTEDVSMWYDESSDSFYGVFHAHTYIGMISSEDGIHWDKTSEYKLMSKEVLLDNGDKIIPDRLERPFIYVENNESKVLSLAVKEGDESYIVFIPIQPK